MIKSFITAFILGIFSLTTFAQAAEDEPYTFSPPGCEFEVTFPTEPAIQKRCPPTAKAGCYDVATFSKVYDYNATISFEISCNLITKELRDAYDQAAIEALLSGAAKRKGMETKPKLFFEEPEKDGKTYKIGAVSGLKKSAANSHLFIYQIWRGDQSIMLIDAEMSESSHLDADQTFASIISSIRITESKDTENDTKDAE